MSSVAKNDVKSSDGKSNAWAWLDNLKNGVSNFSKGVEKVASSVGSIVDEVKGVRESLASPSSFAPSGWKSAYNEATDKLTGDYWRK